jgi:hypothetical protein
MLLATAGLVLLVGIFVWKPLTHGGYYSAADLLQEVDLLRVDGAHEPANNQLGDPVYVIHPWLEWSRAQIRDGDLPTWNPYNGGGAPLLGNYQSAVFSPFSLPFLLLPMQAALVVSAIAKILTAGVGTLAFLKRIGRSTAASLVGSIAFMFAGYQVLWLQWPIPSAAVLLPVLLLFVEVTITSATRYAAARGAIAAGFVTALILVTGHPETIFFVFAIVGGYAVFRLLTERRRRWITSRALALVVAAGAGLALAAVQILPFIEYLQRSSALESRSEKDPVFLSGHLAGLNAFPRLLGSPLDSYRPDFIFSLVNGSYVGLIVLFLAGFGFFSLVKRRAPVTAYFAALALGWILYAYNVLGLGSLLSQLPLLSLAHAAYSQVVWLFAITVLAAAGVDWLRSRPIPKRSDVKESVRVGGSLVLTAAGLALLVYILQRNLRASEDFGVDADAAARVARDSIVWIGVSFCVGVISLLILVLSRTRALRLGAIVVLASTIFAQSGFYLRDYNPTIATRYFYPTTRLLEDVRHTTHDEMTLGAATSAIPAEANIWYRLRSPATYDVLGVRNYTDLGRRLLGYPKTSFLGGAEAPGLVGPSNPSSLAALRTMGVRWVTSDHDYPWGPRVSKEPLPDTTMRLRALDSQGTVHAIVTRGRVAANLVSVRTDGATPDVQCGLAVRSMNSAITVASATQPCRNGVTTFPVSLPAGGDAKVELSFSGPSQVSVGVDQSGRPIAGLWATRVRGLESVWQRDGVTMFAVPGAVARYYSPPRVESVVFDDATLDRLAANDFDPKQTLLVAGDVGSESVAETTSGTVKVLEEGPTRVRLRVTRDQPGWLAAMQSYFPGWHAKVDGVSTPILRANYAFQAIAVGAGTSEVEFSYRPASVRNGSIISVLAALAFVGASIGLVVYHRRRLEGGRPVRTISSRR